MNHSGVMPNRKPFANSFLSVRNTIASHRPVISSGAKRSREIFLANSLLPVRSTTACHLNRKPFANSFLPVRSTNGVTPNRNPFTNIFLPA